MVLKQHMRVKVICDFCGRGITKPEKNVGRHNFCNAAHRVAWAIDNNKKLSVGLEFVCDKTKEVRTHTQKENDFHRIYGRYPSKNELNQYLKYKREKEIWRYDKIKSEFGYNGRRKVDKEDLVKL